MNLQETLALLEALRSAGVTKFKSLEHDICFGGSTNSQIKKIEPQLKEEPIIANEEATEKLKDLISTLKMSDEELANQIFPDGAI